VRLGLTPRGIIGFLAHPDVGLLVPRDDEASETSGRTTKTETGVLPSPPRQTSSTEKKLGWKKYKARQKKSSAGDLLGWKYNANLGYKRPLKEAEWLRTATGGDVEAGGVFGLRNMVGYDICFFIRDWLAKNEKEKFSVCEVLLLDARFKPLQDEVGCAEVFWSHMQQEPFLGERLSEEREMSRIDPWTRRLETVVYPELKPEDAAAPSTLGMLWETVTARDGEKSQSGGYLAAQAAIGEHPFLWMAK